MNIIQSFNAKNPGYDVVFADESGWVKGLRGEVVYIFEFIDNEFVLRGSYPYYVNLTHTPITGPSIGYVKNQVNFL